MKNLKFGVLAFGALGLIACFLPMISFGDESISFFKMREGAAANVYITMAGFAAAAIFGLLGVIKPPFAKVNGIVAIAGFAAALVMMTDKKPHKIFDGFSGAIGAKLLVIAVLGGLIVSIMATVKSEE